MLGWNREALFPQNRAISYSSNRHRNLAPALQSGLFDRRIENGERKVIEEFLDRLLEVVAVDSQQSGWKRPTWTRELLIKTMTRQTGIYIALSTTSQALQLVMDEETQTVLFDFDGVDAAKEWQNVIGRVMSCVAKGKFMIREKKTLEFFGMFSLETQVILEFITLTPCYSGSFTYAQPSDRSLTGGFLV